MNLPDAVILGVIEGLSEFLPISSTGHLILTSDLLGLQSSEFSKSFNIFIQSGAILAVLVLYGRELTTRKDLIYKVFVAFLPTAVIGLALYKFIKEYLLGSVEVTLWALFLGGIALIFVELYFKKSQVSSKQSEVSSFPALSYIRQNKVKENSGSLSTLTYKNAFLVGLCQSVAVIPGVSRSAASIIGGMLFGMNRSQAVEFSFLLAIPTLLAATGLDLVETNFSFSLNEWMLLITGFITSFIVAVLVMKWFISYVKKYTFIPFGIYRIVVAILFAWLILFS